MTVRQPVMRLQLLQHMVVCPCVHLCHFRPQGLPYGTMSDDEMRAMGIAQLQDDGVIFMWVTGAHNTAWALSPCSGSSR